MEIKLRQILQSKNALMAAIALTLTVLLLLLTLRTETKEATPSSDEPPSTDTLIPPGFVLIEVELENSEFIDSILGQYGKVDLFARSIAPPHKLIKLATRIKMIRAPKNPNVFGVLAPASNAANIARHPGPFLAVVQNPHQVGTNIEVEAKPKRSRKIIYDSESGE